MLPFNYINPCRVIFGDDAIRQIGMISSSFGKRALLVTGKGSIKQNGIFNIVGESLKSNGIDFIEYQGVKPNPIISHAEEGIKITKEFKPDVIIGVGGGSVIDESKTIAFGALSNDHPWESFRLNLKPANALPLIAIPTIFGSGTELNTGTVMSNSITKEKKGISSQALIPKAAIIDPTVSFTVPLQLQVAGFVDALSHLFEGYFNGTETYVPVHDEISETLSKILIRSALGILKNPHDIDCRRNGVWATCLAHQGQLNMGRGKISFNLHSLAHDIGELFDIPHSYAISISILPWLSLLDGEKKNKLCSWGRSVFNLGCDLHQDTLVQNTISSLRDWMKKLHIPLSISDYLNLCGSKISFGDNIESLIYSRLLVNKEINFSENQLSVFVKSIV